MTNKQTVLCGFSINPELGLGFTPKTNNKHEIKNPEITLSGSSINIAKCLQNMGHKAHALILTGGKNGSIWNQMISDALIKLLHNSGIQNTHFNVLNEPSFAIVPTDLSGQRETELFGLRGKINQDLIKEVYSKIEESVEGFDWVTLSGVRLEEVELAKIVLKKGQVGKRLLIPKPELISSVNFKDVLQYVDLLIMNKAEFATYPDRNIEKLHEYGPKVVIVTDSANGGIYSNGNGVFVYEPYKVETKNNTTVGCGDWFAGAFNSWCLENDSDYSLDSLSIKNAVNFSAQISAKKINYSGGSNGPKREDIISE